jgi:anaerobic magnesium-protoporphyrin IX monomethyl ester cyclase
MENKRLKIALITPIEDDIPVQVSAYQALRDAGYEIRHYCEHSGSIVDWDYVLSCDYVCFSLLTFCAFRGYQHAERVRQETEATIVFGGCHASVAPEDCLDHCDYVVRNEGEETLLELIPRLEADRSVEDLAGISYRDKSGTIRHNPDRPFISDLSRQTSLSIIEGYPPNKLSRFIGEALRRRQIPRISLPVAQGSRGCVHRCRFCMVKYELGSAFRRRPPKTVVAEILDAFDHLGSRTVFFVDNDFTHDSDHAIAILEPLADMLAGKLSVYFFSRVELARKTRLLEVLKRIQNVYLGIGFESTSDRTLSEFAKGQRHGGFEDHIRVLHGYGFNIHGLFIFGADSDTAAGLQETIAFATRNRLYTVGFSALYDIPGKEKTVGLPQLIPDHRFIHRDWRLFTGHFVVFFPLQMRPSQLQRLIIEGQRHFFRKNRETFFQYFPVYASSEPYIRYLEEQEEGLYDSRDRLIEKRLLDRPFEHLPSFVSIQPSRRVLIREIGEFFLQNATRATAWRMLASNFNLVRRRRGEPTIPGSLSTVQP